MIELKKMSSPRVAVVFATMNRSATAVRCVKALAAQTRAPELVIVAENVSSDNTVPALESLSGLPFDLVVHRMDRNRGNAGGVQVAMSMAFEKGADAVWILDDDSWPRSDALEHLLEPGWKAGVVRHALQVDAETGRLTWPLPIDNGGSGWKLIWTLEDLPEERFIRTKAAWTGALIPREVHDAVGPVNGELFIRGEDEEYPWRIEKGGFSFEAAKNAVMDHPGPKNMIHWKFLGRSLFLERRLDDSKLYYKVRNMVWLRRRQAGNLEAILMALSYYVGISIVDSPRRIPLLWLAIRHGWAGHLGVFRQQHASRSGVRI